MCFGCIMHEMRDLAIQSKFWFENDEFSSKQICLVTEVQEIPRVKTMAQIQNNQI